MYGIGTVVSELPLLKFGLMLCRTDESHTSCCLRGFIVHRLTVAHRSSPTGSPKHVDSARNKIITGADSIYILMRLADHGAFNVSLTRIGIPTAL